MNYLYFIADYLKGKQIYAPIRRVLNFIFLISITSFFYEVIYGRYVWIEITEYQMILDFFVKGSFFIPLTIFTIVYFITYMISYLLFDVRLHFKKVKNVRKIERIRLAETTVEKRLEELEENTEKLAPVTIGKNNFLEFYNKLKSYIDKKEIQLFKKIIDDSKNNLSDTSRIIVRGLLAITIYFFQLPQFGWVLYILILVLIILYWAFNFLAYRLLDLLPALALKIDEELLKYVKLKDSIKSNS